MAKIKNLLFVAVLLLLVGLYQPAKANDDNLRQSGQSPGIINHGGVDLSDFGQASIVASGNVQEAGVKNPNFAISSSLYVSDYNLAKGSQPVNACKVKKDEKTKDGYSLSMKSRHFLLRKR